jgi:pimeloyl-ACP methyl ester carboxylesterase
LTDGRRLGYAVWGDRDGESAFLFHGAPGSRMFAPDPMVTAQAGVRLVTVDRPGYGRSDPLAGRSILDWPSDVRQLADRLEAARFAVLAHSSGGPYALACALAMPERVAGVALVSCVAPYDDRAADADDDDEAFTDLARESPEQAVAQVARAAGWLVADPDGFLDLPRPEPDRLLLADPDVRAMFARTIREAVSQGIDAYAWECMVERQPWDFPLAGIGTEVAIWQGGQDVAVPPALAAALAQALPRNHVHLVRDAGHGLILSAWEDILNNVKL